ncbi:MAG: prepilin-type N-terminal cleavage/methylation domain-containing protein, partial [Pseudohongiella sp.]|nr:prepilin-type N-terminal cleavage/methylation domain-containing protein [Pseudohongiella sp.]
MKSNKNAGFTLIEMSIVLLIMGLILGGLLAALGQSTESTRRTDASTQIKLIEEALYGYAQTYGRLPCPSTHLTAGVEAPVGGGACTANHGFVPSATLGLQGAVNPDGLMTDPWG